MKTDEKLDKVGVLCYNLSIELLKKVSDLSRIMLTEVLSGAMGTYRTKPLVGKSREN